MQNYITHDSICTACKLEGLKLRNVSKTAQNAAQNHQGYSQPWYHKEHRKGRRELEELT
jgi:hypothetical protein